VTSTPLNTACEASAFRRRSPGRRTGGSRDPGRPPGVPEGGDALRGLLYAGTAASDGGAGSYPIGRRVKLPVPWETERSAPA
jgi:hypothetical protein